MTTHNLPHQSTGFIGRTEELAQINSLLADPNCCLLTIVGAGGIGKTRLALQSAAGQISYFAQGVYFVPLTSVTSTDLLPAAIAHTLQVSFYGSGDSRGQIIRYLREQHILLLMDNFEHLLEASDLLTEILQTATKVKFLVTSRERLNLQEEWVLTLEGLSYPEGQVTDSLENYSAVQLFAQRARQVQPAFSLMENTEAVRTICHLVEGNPLAIELATSWLCAMSCQQITAQIAGGSDFLTTPMRNVPERHRSLHTVFEQSWNQLLPVEQWVLMRLSVFRGGFDLEAAEQVAGATPVLLAHLVDKSLIRLNTAGRYDLHELLRQYIADKLQAAGELTTTVQRHGDYFLRLAEGADAHAFGREQIAWFDRLEVEFANLRTALTCSLERGDAVTGLRIAVALGWFFSERTHWSEGLDWLERLLTANPDAPSSLRMKALYTAGALAGLLEDEPRTRVLCAQAIALARATNDRLNLAWSLSHLGNYIISDPAQSAAFLEESLALFRGLGDAMGITHTLIRRAWKAIQEQRDYAYGRALLEEAEIPARKADDKVLTAWIPYMLGLISCLQDNDLRQAKLYFESSVRLFREARCRFHEPIILLADVEQAMGNTARAQLLYEETLVSLQRNMIVHPYLSWVLAGLVSVARSLGQLEQAAYLLGAASGIGLDEKRNSPDIANFGTGAAVIREIQDQLGDSAFAEAWAAGKAMRPAQIIAYALQGGTTPRQTALAESTVDSAGQSQQTASPPLSELLKARELEVMPISARSARRGLAPEALTPHEQEVLHLIAAGASNRQIAEALGVTVGTVKTYTHRIYQKLDVESRVQAVSRARSLNLI
ncbi:MAG: LuxR C-terminal-related transcriptional regulator [Chloroflexota bacterium]